MGQAVNDRRAIIAIGGAVVGVVGGAAAAANGAPIAGILAAFGALIAGLVVAFSPAEDIGDGIADDDQGTPTVPAPRIDPPVQRRSTVVTRSSAATAPTIPATPMPSVANAPADAQAPSSTPAAAPPDAAAPPAGATPPAPPEKPNLFNPPPQVPPASAPLLTDPETGLFSQDYFDIAIEARLAAARRHLRPVGVVLLEVIEGLREDRPHPANPVMVAESVRTTLREADTASRRKDGKFALLLEDTPENGAIWTVERIRRHLVEIDPGLTVWAGVACYPAHAFDKVSILRAADAALVAAREWHQDRIEVAIGE
jgi:two-component system cell cycle response regulator